MVFNLASGTPGMYRLESDLHQLLLRLIPAPDPAEEVVIVAIDGQLEEPVPDQDIDFLLDRSNYAALALRLIEEAEAGVVVINLPSSFVVPQNLGGEDLDAPLRQVVQSYVDRLVLATRSSESFQQEEISIYNHFLPFNSLQLEYLVPPEEVQGVVQYQVDPAGILRYAELFGQFKRRDSQQFQMFFSVEVLALAKWDTQAALTLLEEEQNSIQFAPLEPDAIPILPIESVCPPPSVNPCLTPADPGVLEQLRGKIVLVGFVSGYPETYPVTLATGEPIPAIHLQGQILSSLLNETLYHSLPVPLQLGVVLLIGLGTGVGLVWRRDPLRLDRSSLKHVLIPVLGLGLYMAWGIAQFLIWRWIWPLATPLWVGLLTLVSVLILMILLQNRQRLQEQQIELERLQRAEQEAAVDQARKLLYRVATDIHDRELQELKLVMDKVELMQWQSQQQQPLVPSAYDPVLQQLEGIGQGIRDQLNDVRTLASKLHVSPELKEGLHLGIQTHLERLVATGSLTLSVQQTLEPLQEISTSEWLDMREDILRFLREAMGNVIGHVQPPKGNGTYVNVHLRQRQHQCCLEIVNDGEELGPPRKGGYGSKAMNTIAQGLPGGSWRRHRSPTGETRVELHWTMPQG